MRISCLAALGAIFLFGAMNARALDPTVVDGVVSVTVDHSQQPWSVTVTNRSEQELTFEMVGKVPRGLGMEVWKEDLGIRLHAEGLAALLNTDGFPADLRDLKPKESIEFQLNPKSMSSVDKGRYEKWERIEKMGYYKCRVFFGIYASRLISVAPSSKANKTSFDQSAATEGATPSMDLATARKTIIGNWFSQRDGVRGDLEASNMRFSDRTVIALNHHEKEVFRGNYEIKGKKEEMFRLLFSDVKWTKGMKQEMDNSAEVETLGYMLVSGLSKNHMIIQVSDKSWWPNIAKVNPVRYKRRASSK